MTTATKQPAVGDPVVFEGLPCRIVGVTADRVEFHSELRHTGPKLGPDGKTFMASQARFQTACARAELKWSDDIGAWYLWGRLLAKGRGGSGLDERAVVSELRDRGLLPARATRQNGTGPAGGEHHNLHAALFRKGINWAQELANVRLGEGLSDAAKAAVADYAARFRKKLVDGFADPGADDSTGEA